MPIPAHTHGLTNATIETTGAHTHTVSGSANSEGGHTHTVTGTVSSGGAHRHEIKMMNSAGRHAGSQQNPSWDYTAASNYTETGGEHSHTFSNGSTSGGGHTHSLNGTANSDGIHTHKLTGSTDSFGGDSSSSCVIDTVPSYYTLVYIMKVK
jgi:hypothetical protein